MKDYSRKQVVELLGIGGHHVDDLRRKGVLKTYQSKERLTEKDKPRYYFVKESVDDYAVEHKKQIDEDSCFLKTYEAATILNMRESKIIDLCRQGVLTAVLFSRKQGYQISAQSVYELAKELKDDDETTFLTAQEAARILRCSTFTIYRLCRSEQLDSKIKNEPYQRHYLIDKQSLLDYMNRNIISSDNIPNLNQNAQQEQKGGQLKMMNILTSKEVADVLKVSTNHVQKLCKNGELKSYKEGRKGGFRILESSLNEYIMKRMEGEIDHAA